MLDIIRNPVVISVILMCVLCLLKLNVLLVLIISSMVGGIAAGMPIDQTMTIFMNGMAGNSETALSYILLGYLQFVRYNNSCQYCFYADFNPAAYLYDESYED